MNIYKKFKFGYRLEIAKLSLPYPPIMLVRDGYDLVFSIGSFYIRFGRYSHA